MKYKYTDEKGYEREVEVEHSNLVHRDIAYKDIYLKNREKYPLPFSEYDVHHIDGNKKNNNVENLIPLTREQHESVHEFERRLQIKFKSRQEIFEFLEDEEEEEESDEEVEEQEISLNIQMDRSERFVCLECGKAFKHKTNCIIHNIDRNHERFEHVGTDITFICKNPNNIDQYIGKKWDGYP